jgi:NADPH2:quinone reductase
LLHAGAGGVGQILTQLARIRGARVITTVGTPEKAEISRKLGADPAIVYTKEDFQEAVTAATGGKGVDVVYDSVGQATFMKSLKCLKKRGTISLFGGASGAVKSVDPLDLAESGSVFLTRPHMADYMQNAEEIGGRSKDMFDHVRSGRVKVTIDREFPLADARKAHDALEGRSSKGKLLLKVAEAA